VCPLTPIEKHFRRRGDAEAYEGGFVDRYIEDVVYPDEYTPHVRLVAAALIANPTDRELQGQRAHANPSSSRGRPRRAAAQPPFACLRRRIFRPNQTIGS
jgi:Protein of Unknown function (DUF2784)